MNAYGPSALLVLDAPAGGATEQAVDDGMEPANDVGEQTGEEPAHAYILSSGRPDCRTAALGA